LKIDRIDVVMSRCTKYFRAP